MPGYKKPSHVHVAPLPDQYRGRHHYSDEDASIKYAAEVKNQIAKLEEEGKRLAAFICEPYFVESGVHPPTSRYYQEVYRLAPAPLSLYWWLISIICSAVRAHGGLVIADEVGTTFGIILSVSKYLVSESDGFGKDWRAHVGLPKFWSGPRHRHNRSVNVQRLSHGCCDMLKVNRMSLRPESYSCYQGRCQRGWEDTSPRLGGTRLLVPSASPSWRLGTCFLLYIFYLQWPPGYCQWEADEQCQDGWAKCSVESSETDGQVWQSAWRFLFIIKSFQARVSRRY